MGIDEASELETGSAGVWGIAQAIWGRKVWGTKFVKLLFGASHHPLRRNIPFPRAHSTDLDVPSSDQWKPRPTFVLANRLKGTSPPAMSLSSHR
jgi:hypothetical protein